MQPSLVRSRFSSTLRNSSIHRPSRLPSPRCLFASPRQRCLQGFSLRPLSNRSLRHFTSTSSRYAPEPIAFHTKQATPTTIESYHEYADNYIDQVVAELEEIQETREEVDVEYSQGVMTLVFPPNGTYVLNKQPPNRQIWLSSPISGPKRYDYVERDRRGEWVYLRDGSTLTDLLREELGLDLDPFQDVDN